MTKCLRRCRAALPPDVSGKTGVAARDCNHDAHVDNRHNGAIHEINADEESLRLIVLEDYDLKNKQ